MDEEKRQQDEEKRKAALEERRLRREARKKRKDALEREKAEQRERDLDLLDELEQEHGDDEVRPVWSDGPMVVIKRPKKPQIDRWREMVGRKTKADADAQRRREAADTLAKQVLLHPDKVAYNELVERWPGIPTLVAAEALAFAQMIYEEEAEK